VFVLREKLFQYLIRTDIRDLLIVIDSLILRLATVSLSTVARDYYAKYVIILGGGLSRSSLEKIYG
jgi:hypothetical protein